MAEIYLAVAFSKMPIKCQCRRTFKLNNTVLNKKAKRLYIQSLFSRSTAQRPKLFIHLLLHVSPSSFV